MGISLHYLFYFSLLIFPAFSGTLGPEFQLTTYQSSDHSNFFLSKMSFDTGYAVAYQSSSNSNLLLDLFYPNGSLIVPSITLSNQMNPFNPSLCYIKDYGLAAVYSTFDYNLAVANVSGQVYQFSGAPSGQPFLVNSSQTENPNPKVAQLNNYEGFVVAYRQYASSNTTNATYNIFFQIFNNTGVAVSNTIQANTIWNLGDHAIAYLPTPAGFAIVFTGNDSNIYIQIFENNGDKVGQEYQVNTNFPCSSPAVVGMSERLIVVYSCNVDGSINLYGQYLSPLGTKISSEFIISNPLTNYVTPALASVNSYDQLIVVYSDGESTIYSTMFDLDGNQIQPQMQINTAPAFPEPQIATINAGYIVMYFDNSYTMLRGQMETSCPQDLFWNGTCLSNYVYPPPQNLLPYFYQLCPENGTFPSGFCCPSSCDCNLDVCESCSSGSALNTTGNSCDVCPAGAGNCTVNNGQMVAVSCVNGYFLYEGSCIQCQPNCATCIAGQIEPAQLLPQPLCIACNPNFYGFENTCVGQCPSGTVDTLAFCCPPHCFFCNNGSYICDECFPSYSLFPNGTCLQSCPPGYASNITDNSCVPCPTNVSTCYLNNLDVFVIESCNPGFSLFDNICFSTCPPQTYNVTGNYCCPALCESCLNGSFTCEVCQLGYFVYEGSCVSSCPQLTINDRGNCISIEAMCELVCDVSYLCTVGFFSDQCEVVRPIIVIVAILSLITSIGKLYLLVRSQEQTILIRFLRNHAYSDIMVSFTIVVVFDPRMLQSYNPINMIIFYGNLLSCFFTVEIFFFGFLKMKGNTFFENFHRSIIAATYVGTIFIGVIDVLIMDLLYASPYVIIGLGGILILGIDGVIVFKLKQLNASVDFKNLIVYPSILAITWGLSSISFLGVSLSDGFFWVAFTASLMNYAQPMLNTLLYGRRIFSSFIRYKKIASPMKKVKEVVLSETLNPDRTTSEVNLSHNTSFNQIKDFYS